MNTHRKCSLRACGKYQQRSTMIVRGVNAWCNIECQTQHALQNLSRGKEKAHKQRKADFKAKDKPYQLKLTQAAFNELVRELDKGKGCISCDKPASWSGQWHASHLKSVGSHSMLRFDARNCHKACSICNKWLSGNLPNYRANLVIEYGQEILDYLDGPHEAKHYNCQDLIQLRAEFTAESRRLRSGLAPSKDWRACTLPSG